MQVGAVRIDDIIDTITYLLTYLLTYSMVQGPS